MPHYQEIGGPSGNRSLVCAVGVAFTAVVLALSISAIVLSVRAVNDKKSDDKVNACYYSSKYAPKQPEIVFNYPTGATVIRNGVIWTGTVAGVLNNYDILIIDGRINRTGPTPIGDIPEGATVYDAAGAFITPGIVDMHSHAGVAAFPEDAHATQDDNEATNPELPQMRTVDAIDPDDPAFPLIRSGGVTTSLILPGSANLIGGQASYVKLKTGMVQDMLIPGAPVAFKMATGENPKNVYGERDQLPSTRMGNAWGFRQIFAQAAVLKEQQDVWDCVQSKGTVQDSPRPADKSLDPLVMILREQANVNVHCYEIQDFESILRVADEFGFKVNAFHHALEAYRIPQVFAERNITIATFADMFGFKMEAYNASAWSPAILANNSVKVALKSDHPVLYAKYLIFEAVKAFHYGLSVDDALRAVTVVPANSIGLGDRIGSLEVGKDGDVVIWNNHPLTLGARPTKVFIEGQLYVDNPPTAPASVTPPSFSENTLVSPINVCENPEVPFGTYAVVASNLYTMDGREPIQGQAVVSVVDGMITCAGTIDECPIGDNPVFNLDGGWIAPGTISASSEIGLMEVEQEENSWDGYVYDDDSAIINTADGIRLRSKHVWAAFAGGVTAQIAAPQGVSLISGTSSAFYTRGLVAATSLVSETVALHIHVGNNAKTSTWTNSVSGQFAQIRSLFKNPEEGPIADALSGALPIVFHVDQADEIGSVLRLKRQFNLSNVVIHGGAEASIVASLLNESGVSVVLSPSRACPQYFETERTTDSDARILAQAGVTLAIAQPDASYVRNLRWEAGYALSYGLTYTQALASITSNVAKMFNLPHGVGTITPGTKANFVLYDGDPLTISSRVALVALGESIYCYPKQM